MGTEDLQLFYWDGSSWLNLFTDLTSNSWNNASVPITGSSLTLRFKGANITNDTTQDSWEIDAVQLHTWNNSYELEVEISGTSDTYVWTQLGWVLDLQFSVATVNVTIQLYNYTDTEYPGTGFGFIQYDSGPADTDEFKSQIISSSMGNFKDGSGNWQVKVLALYVGFRADEAGGREAAQDTGETGDFRVKIFRKARYIDETTCNGCNDCASVCPVEVPNEFDENIGFRKAIILAFALLSVHELS